MRRIDQEQNGGAKQGTSRKQGGQTAKKYGGVHIVCYAPKAVNMKKLGIALGSGGSRGVAHLGFLQALEEEGIRADYVSGCSMGAIVGACYCAGASMNALKEVAVNLRLSRIASFNINAIKASGLFNLGKAKKLLAEYIGKDTQFSDLKIPFCCVATDLVSGRSVRLDAGNVIDCALASGSIPGAFPPVLMDDMMLVDGGVLERVPARELKRMGADVVVAVDVLGDLPASKPQPKNLIETMLRYIDVIDTHVTRRMRAARRRYIDLWLEPDLGDMDQYQVKNLGFAFDRGYELGKANAGKITELLQDGSV